MGTEEKGRGREEQQGRARWRSGLRGQVGGGTAHWGEGPWRRCDSGRTRGSDSEVPEKEGKSEPETGLRTVSKKRSGVTGPRPPRRSPPGGAYGHTRTCAE